MQAYDIYKYSLEQLVDVMVAASEADKFDIERKFHTEYFHNYFSSPDIQAKSFLAEHRYIDHDYLEDYRQYYVLCYNKYRRACTRLHFFDDEIDEKQFEAALRGDIPDYQEYLQEHYLGFVVVKPLPKTIIGRTCLKTYGVDGDRRHYLSVCEIKANLFGFELKVHSLPFQEQDSVVAACATSALWSAFKVSGRKFQHHIPSPSAITEVATATIPGEGRYFPNKNGLTAAQMSAAIRSVGLEPLKECVEHPDIFRHTLYAYLKNGIPVLLLFKLGAVPDN